MNTSLTDVLIPVSVGIGMYVFLYACEYLWNLLIVAPVQIDAERQKEIDALRLELETIRRDKASDFHHRVAESVVPGLSHAGKSILRYLWSHDQIVWASDLTIYGLSTDTVWKTLTELKQADLVTENAEPAALGKNEKVWWEITPGYKSALGNLLFF
ncbi:MAG TPA: hypothetical protein VHC90_03115 [Bryobacteraceae bacterium]|nr:hypothetical protein [Bryobacteraceae bacterium]